jgi:hypothetical protein
MISAVFKYAVLQYIPSQVLKERVNVGLLLFFPTSNTLRFLYPTHLKRLKALYHNTQEKRIAFCLDAIAQRIEALNNGLSLFHSNFNNFKDLSAFLDTQVLKRDDSSLQFSDIHQSLLYSADLDRIQFDLYNEFFAEYQHKPQGEHFVSDAEISKLFESSLKKWAPEAVSKIHRNYTIQTDTNEFVFDFAWQNGSLNLVKPVSFDLKEPKRIQEKSILLYGNLSLLQDEALLNNIRFDLIVAEPHERSLYRNFEMALKTIDQAAVNKEIIVRSEIDKYTDKAAIYLLG